MNIDDIRKAIRQYESYCMKLNQTKDDIEDDMRAWFDVTKNNGYVGVFNLNWLSNWQLVVDFTTPGGSSVHFERMDFPYLSTNTNIIKNGGIDTYIDAPDTVSDYDRAMKGI